MSVAIILPAHDEAAWIGACIDAVLASRGDLPAAREIIIVANACSDDTADIARTRSAAADAAGWTLRVFETAKPGKLSALNLAEAATTATQRIYLDADVIVDTALIAALCRTLQTDQPRYATGTVVIPDPRSAVSRAYGRFWKTLPFLTEDAPGFGLFAVNDPGRARWGAFPDIISDDTFVRLQFAPSERVRVPATYSWPLVEGFAHLVRVRRRQNRGVAEISERFPELLANTSPPPPSLSSLARRALQDPLGFCAYAGIAPIRMPARRSIPALTLPGAAVEGLTT